MDLAELICRLSGDGDLKQACIEFFDILPCGICQVRIDEELSFVYANEFFYQTFGFSSHKDASQISRAKDLVHPEDFSLVRDQIKNNIAQGIYSFELEHRLFHKSGKLIWGLIRCRYSPSMPKQLICVFLDISQRKNTEEQLRISEEENRIAFELTDTTMAIYNLAAKTLILPPKAAYDLNLPIVVEDVPYSIVKRKMIAPESEEEYIFNFQQIQNGNPNGVFTLQVQNRDGVWRWLRSKYALIFDEGGNPLRAVITLEDITRQRENELAYQKWVQYFSVERENSIGYYEYNLTRDLYAGNREENIWQLPPEISTFTGAVNYVKEHLIYEEDLAKYTESFCREALLTKFYSGQQEVILEHRRKRKDGSPFWVLGTIQLLSDPYTSDIKAFVLIKDIDDYKKMELSLQNLIEQDALTGLLNRSAFIDKVKSVLARDTSARHSLIMLDIDHFKRLNDTLGHQFGDQALVHLAGLLKSTLRAGDLCGRLGGDEFMVFLRDVPADVDIRPRLENIRQIMRQEYKDNIQVSASMGVSYFPQDGESFEVLYHKSDVALYEAKRSGRSCYMIYSPDMEAPQ